MHRVVLIGMNNPISVDPEYALFPRPAGCSGHRLWSMMNDAVDDTLSAAEYVRIFHRVNLVRGEWNRRAAASKASGLLRTDEFHKRRVVLLGNEVLLSFSTVGVDLRKYPQFEFYKLTGKDCGKWAHIPHPSGWSHTWNRQEIRDQARTFFKELVKLAREAAQE